MHKLIIFILLICFTSCKAKQVLVSSQITDKQLITEQLASEKKDNIRISEKYTDQEITIPGDSLHVLFPLVIGDSGKLAPASIEVRGERAQMKIDISESGIEAIATCDEYQAQIKVLERSIESYEKEKTSLSSTVESYKNENKVLKEEKTAFQKTLMGIKKTIKTGIIIAAVISIIAAAVKYRKPILSIIKKLF